MRPGQKQDFQIVVHNFPALTAAVKETARWPLKHLRIATLNF